MSRKIEFCVPTDLLVDFAEELVSHEMQAMIAGSNEEGEIILVVEYEKEESSEVDKMEAILEKLKEEAGIEND